MSMASMSTGISFLFSSMTCSIHFKAFLARDICLAFDKYVKSLLLKSDSFNISIIFSFRESIPVFVLVLPLIIGNLVFIFSMFFS